MSGGVFGETQHPKLKHLDYIWMLAILVLELDLYFMERGNCMERIDEYGQKILILSNGVEILPAIEVTQGWIEQNQPVIEPQIQLPTNEERLEALEMALLSLMEL